MNSLPHYYLTSDREWDPKGDIFRVGRKQQIDDYDNNLLVMASTSVSTNLFVPNLVGVSHEAT